MPTADIFADRYWNETGIHLVAGCRYKFSVVSGVGATLKDASFTARSIAGEDWTSLPHKTAELFNGIPGIGGLVKDASNYNNTPVVLVGIFAIGISGLIIDGLLRAIERRAVPWRGKI